MATGKCYGLLHVEKMELEIGYSLIPLVDADQGEDLLDRIIIKKAVRENSDLLSHLLEYAIICN